MIHFLRKVRKRLLTENSFGKYLIYAIGEILLVVVGILIALQIDNYNEERKDRKTELAYLKNIKTDLLINGEKIQELIKRRDESIVIAQQLVGHIEGNPVEDWHQFNLKLIRIYAWQRFYQHSYTFNELISSGNLSYIKNDSIKTLLFDLESTYIQLKAEEDHWRFDSEELVYKPSYDHIDMQMVLRDYKGEKGLLSRELFKDFFADLKIKNGYSMAIVEFETMNGQLKQMQATIDRLLELIEKEITKG